MSEQVPDGWAKGELDTFCEVNPRLTQRDSLNDETKVSFLRMEDVSNSANVTNKRIRQYKQVSKGFTSFQNNDVLLAKITPCLENGKGGYVENLINGVGFGSTEFHVLRARNNSVPRYIFQLSISDEFRKQAESNMTGSAGQRRVQTDFLRSYKTTFPPKPEQHKIAYILTSVDEVIENTEAQISKLQDLKTAMMRELLTKGIGHTEFKDSPVGRIPKRWDVAKLGELVNAGSPICYGILMPGKGVAGGVPVIKVKNIRDNSVDESDLLHTSRDIDNQYKRSRVRTDDLLVTIRGTTGRIAVVPSTLDGANITQDTARVRIDDRALSEFVYIYLQGPVAQEQIESHTIGQAVKGINLEEVRKLNIALPPQGERKLISSSIINLEKKLLRVYPDFATIIYRISSELKNPNYC